MLLTALAITVAAVIFQETALPELNAKAEEVDRVKIRGQLPRHLQRQTQIWYRSSDTRFWRMELLDPAGRSMDGVMVWTSTATSGSWTASTRARPAGRRTAGS